MEEFLEKVAELLELEGKIDPEMSLTGVEGWDSLSIVSFLAMVDIEYDKVLRVTDFKDAKTFGDLYKYVMGEK